MLRMMLLLVVGWVALARSVSAEEPVLNGDQLVARYFELETSRIEQEMQQQRPLLADPAFRQRKREELLDMLGLNPFPERTPLEPVITGTIEHPEFKVHKVHFQSMPSLYVTGNLYVPANLKGRAPAVLYVCGHAKVKQGNVSYGNKTAYQHHGIWYARHGYVCLIIDTLQLGEIEGIHHGLYSQNRWCWPARGYSPAGVEAWNCVRALDYLQSLPEVDGERLGVTGRSGGGAYSWWIAAIDDRIKAAVPTAGITSLRNHVVDGVVSGHCDCMYQCNTYRWDYDMLPALVAPRALLLSNTDKDPIFPLEGVIDVYLKGRETYRALGAGDHFGLQITEGGHSDTQELHIHSFVWMNRYLKNDKSVIEKAAVKLFEPRDLRVFDELPPDEINTSIDQRFVRRAQQPESVPEDQQAARDKALKAQLDDKVFRAWPAQLPSVEQMDLKELSSTKSGDLTLTRYEYNTQDPYRLSLFVLNRGDLKEQAGPVQVVVLDQAGWERAVKELQPRFPQASFSAELSPKGEVKAELSPTCVGDMDRTDREPSDPWSVQQMLEAVPESTLVLVVPRGVGPTEWSRDTKTRTHIKRRFILLGQTEDSMRIRDVRCAVQAVRSLFAKNPRPVHLKAQDDASTWALYASLYDDPVDAVQLKNLTLSHDQGPVLLNVLRVLDVPEAVGMASRRSAVNILR